MLNWRNRSVDLVASVFFRGSMPPRADDFRYLAEHGVRLEDVDPQNEHLAWCINARHADWGDAEIFAPRKMPAPPRALIAFD